MSAQNTETRFFIESPNKANRFADQITDILSKEGRNRIGVNSVLNISMDIDRKFQESEELEIHEVTETVEEHVDISREEVDSATKKILEQKGLEEYSDQIMDKNEDEPIHVESEVRPDTDFQFNNAYDPLKDTLRLNDSEIKEIESYEGNSQMARKLLETEWKLSNPEEYLEWESFSQGNLAGEAELILSYFSEEKRKKIITNTYEKQKEQIETTWTDQWGNLMGYDKQKQKPVKLVDSYTEIQEQLEKHSKNNQLEKMMEESLKTVENYEKAKLKSLQDSENLRTEIENKKLAKYIKKQKPN